MNKYEEAEKMAKRIIELNSDDNENLHVRLDDLLLFILRKEGYGKVVELFESCSLWYS